MGSYIPPRSLSCRQHTIVEHRGLCEGIGGPRDYGRFAKSH
jgi:hypothetical protein